MTETRPATDAAHQCVPEIRAGHREFELFFEGDKLYTSMLSQIARAHTSIRLESYIFANDEIGWRFAEALAERTANGIDVRMHLDAAGFFSRGSVGLKRWLREKKISVRVFHRWRWRDPWRYNQRNHRKMLIIDDQQLFLGGFNIHRQSSLELSGNARWRDTHLQMNGTIAHSAGRLFDDFWHGKQHRQTPQEEAVCILIPNFNRNCRQVLKCLYTDSFRNARRRICLTTPYFVPDQHTQKNLQAAARRGLEVKLLVPRKNNHRLVQWASRAAYANLLASGVQIYEYLPRMLHAKTAVVDKNWATVGTANLDYRSLFVNHEITLASRDPKFCSRLDLQFEVDLKQSEKICPGRWAKRPWVQRIAEFIGWLARRLL